MQAQRDDAWHDQQYNNRARVADSARILGRWTEASALVRRQLDARLDLAYGDDPAERLDVFPAEHPGSPVLLFIHGGYWRALDKSDHSFVAPAFLKAGAAVVVPNYGLCPQASIAQIALQMSQALVWTWRHAREFGGDSSRIGVVGHSAGAHLAAMMLCCRWKEVDADLPQRPILGALGLSGVYDLEPLRHAPFLRDDLQLDASAVRRLSPAYYPRPRGPLLAAVGALESDEFLRQNQLIRDQWGPTTVPVCETIPHRHHFDILHDLVDASSRVHHLALRVLGLV